MPERLQTSSSSQPVARRPAGQVMRLARFGCAHPTRLSFLRILLRRVQQQQWRFDRPVWNVDANGVGVGVYRAIAPDNIYSLVAFSHDLPDAMRSDRVIATAWDATFTLFDGEPTAADIDRLSRNVPLQEAGRVSFKELSLSRANRSVRLFDHVVERLAQGQQPDAKRIESVGYLMRTTAVYGSGKFGAADRADIVDRASMAEPFQVEMLSVWLTRQFVVDIAEHLAKCKGGSQAVRLEPALRRQLGVGNSTGLGMAPFIVRHPQLLNQWVMVREEALARVRSQNHADTDAIEAVSKAVEQAQINAQNWHSEHPLQVPKLVALRADLDTIAERMKGVTKDTARPWNALWLWAERTLSMEGQEALLSILLEPYGDLVDKLSEQLSADEQTGFRLDGAMSVNSLRKLIEEAYAWALTIDFNDPGNNAVFWYVSEEKLEPRLGNRATEEGAEREQPLCVARMAKELHTVLTTWPADEPVAAFLLQHPEHRFMVRRAQKLEHYPYAEVRDNLTGSEMLPIDLLRCKLAFFGASHFDPRSDRWVRISLFKGAPYPDELGV